MNTGKQSAPRNEQKLFSILHDDITRGDFKRTMRQEFAELKEVMLTEERRQRLQGMGKLKRGLVLGWWLLKSLIRKLTPARRLLFVLGLIFYFSHFNDDKTEYNFSLPGVIILAFLLILELKDKLIAHEELADGRAVQQALMPERTPQVPGWQLWLFTRSANEVGGDLVDFLRINDKRYGIALGDVAGKGLSAALFSAKLQATLKAIAPDYTSLEMLGSKLNHIYCRDGLRSLFASLHYLEFQPDSGLIRILNAGHLPAVVVRGEKVDTMRKGGPALGIVPDGVYTEERVELGNNDLLIVYSDGLSEAQNIAGEFFGEERFLSLLSRMTAISAEYLGSRLVAEVDNFIGEGKATDDLSIVILRRTS